MKVERPMWAAAGDGPHRVIIHGVQARAGTQRSDAAQSSAKDMSAPMRPGRKYMRRILLGMIFCCAAMPALTAEEDIVLRGMGSFHVGGRVAEVSGAKK